MVDGANKRVASGFDNLGATDGEYDVETVIYKDNIYINYVCITLSSIFLQMTAQVEGPI